VTVWRRLAEMVAAHGSAALVGVHAVRGSAPREAGARMAVRPDGAFHGTIGGGELEWRMLAAAREALARGRGPARFLDQALGPDLGQCCGGRVTVLVETFDARDLDALAALAATEGSLFCALDADGRVRRSAEPFPGEAWREPRADPPTPLWLFGAGHVGRALVLALAPLPFAVRWIDPRDGAFPAHIPASATPVLSPDPEAELARAPEDAMVVVMTHSHPLDLALTAAALRRGFPYVGLIGSASKRARFERRFREIGLPEARIRDLVCPIGVPGIGGKEPAVIAAATVAQILQVRDKVRARLDPPRLRARP
jgi:xanthine dehydrogenase accessory factor